MSVNEVKALVVLKARDMKEKGRSDEYVRAFYGGMIYAFKAAGTISADDASEILNDVFEIIFC